MATKKYEPELKAKIALEAIKNQRSTAEICSEYNAPICLDHFFQSDPIFKMNMLINTSTHI